MNFYQEDVTFTNKEEITLSGTFSRPFTDRKTQAIILVAGYGPNDRDYTGMGHKYFLTLANHLNNLGFAVLRYDKRGVGKSLGNYELATSRDFADDALCGIAYLKTRQDIISEQIGILGHSEGGLIATMIALELQTIAFIILLAPALINSCDNFINTTHMQLKADGASGSFLINDTRVRKEVYRIVTEEQDRNVAALKLETTISSYLEQLSEDLKGESEKLPFAFTEKKKDLFIKTFNSRWYRYYFSIDINSILSQVKAPVLCLLGTQDWIVDAQKTATFLSQLLPNDQKHIVILPKLNHRLQTAATGSLAEYLEIAETISPSALEEISNWLNPILQK